MEALAISRVQSPGSFFSVWYSRNAKGITSRKLTGASGHAKGRRFNVIAYRYRCKFYIPSMRMSRSKMSKMSRVKIIPLADAHLSCRRHSKGVKRIRIKGAAET